MKYDVITILDTCADLVVNLGDATPEFGQKEKWVDSFSLEMGGSNCIFASQCAKLGLRTAGAGFVGADAFGRVVLDGLQSAGVDASHVITDDKLGTGLGVILTRGADRAILTYSGTIGAASPALVNDELLISARHLHVGSYYLLTGLIGVLPGIFARAKKLGLSTSLDTNWDPSEEWALPDEILASVDIFMPNENEAMHLTRAGKAEEAARLLAERIPVVAVKQGAEGGMAVSGDRFAMLPAVDVDVADTIGAGDSFDAGFIYGILNAWELRDCLRAGLYCGSMNAARAGGTAGQARLEGLLAHLGMRD
jgi:sugar/nucleoside kinase (ribokinase family)